MPSLTCSYFLNAHPEEGEEFSPGFQQATVSHQQTRGHGGREGGGL